MLTRERLSLLIAIIMVIALLAFLFATLPLSGTDVSAAPPLTKAYFVGTIVARDRSVR